MEKKTGIWIDTKQAIIIHVKEENVEIINLESGVQTRKRVAGETNKSGRFGDQFLSPEKHKENRQKKQIREYLNDVVDEINQSVYIVIFGPSTMKYILEKEIIQNHVLANRLLAVESADHITQNQMVAWVKGFYKNV